MKISVVKNNLLHAVSALSPIVPTKSTITALYNILLEASSDEGGCLKLVATDLDISLSHKIKATVEKEGAITIPAKKLGEILRELPDSPVGIEQVDEKVKINCAKSNFILPSLPRSDYPIFPTKSFEGAFKVDNQMLRKLVNATSYATGRDEERQILKGLLWEISPDEMAMISTNGHRLAKMSCSTEVKVDQARNVVVPPKALEMVEKLCTEDGQVEVVIDDNHLGIREGNTVIFSRLIEGNYPNYEQVIPFHNKMVAIIDSEKMVEALRRMLILANTVTHRVRLKFSENSVNLSVKTEDLGEGDEAIDADYQGDPLEIYFNGSYLIDMLKYNESDQVKICMQTSESGILAVPAAENEKQRYLNVIMPLKVTE
jgi:DNA polymerase III subunit beta